MTIVHTNDHTGARIFEWDDAKNRGNIAKHGIPFEYATEIFAGRVLVAEDVRKGYGEPRWRAIGVMLGTVIAIAYTVRGERIRIITARKASRNESHAYQAFCHSVA